jgi:hypothetical protein
VRALWASGERRAEGDVKPGMGPGENATVLASLPKEGVEDSHGVLIYADALQNHYADSLDGHSWVWRNRWWKGKFTQPELDDLYADLAQALAGVVATEDLGLLLLARQQGS